MTVQDTRQHAHIYVTLHVIAAIDLDRIEDEDYVLDRASDAISSNEILGAELRDVFVD